MRGSRHRKAPVRKASGKPAAASSARGLSRRRTGHIEIGDDGAGIDTCASRRCASWLDRPRSASAPPVAAGLASGELTLECWAFVSSDPAYARRRVIGVQTLDRRGANWPHVSVVADAWPLRASGRLLIASLAGRVSPAPPQGSEPADPVFWTPRTEEIIVKTMS